MNLIKLLFYDIAKAPIITSATQELWLGIQIRAPKAWAKFNSPGSIVDDVTLLIDIYRFFIKKSNQLERESARIGINIPSIEILTIEALKAYQDIYGLKRSKLLQFVKSASTSDERANHKLVDEVYDLAELICLLPESILGCFVEFTKNNRKVPTKKQFQAWNEHHLSAGIWQMVEERAKQARIILTNGYLRYVLRIARSAIGQGVDYLDLVQEGTLGLMRAAERFDYREGARFVVFASSWIWQGISRALADQGRTIRLPVHMYERVRAVQKLLETETPENVLGMLTTGSLFEEDDEIEIALTSGTRPATATLTQHKACRLLEYCQPLIPLALKLPDPLLEQIGLSSADDVTLADCIAEQDVATSVEQHGWRPIVQILLLDAAEEMNARDLEVLRLRYGLSDGKEHTLEEVGQCFGLTRERIRQIETRALNDLRQILRKKGISIDFAGKIPHIDILPLPVYIYLNEYYSFGQDYRYTEMTQRQQIDYYLAQLPGGDWHAYRVPGTGTRLEQVSAALQILEAPAHYNTIAKKVNELGKKGGMDENYVYAVLAKYEDVFVRLGEGWFSLTEWERQRAAETEPILPFCPTPLPDPPGQPDAFFESVWMICKQLRAPRSVKAFLRALTEWAGLSWPQPRWVCQGALSAYYVVGLIPYIFYEDGREQMLSLASSLSSTDLPTLREYCLATLSRRLQAMPEFWWILQRHQPIQITELARLFVAAHPLGLDDVANRLKLLINVGAVQRSSYGGRYQLTRLGEILAERWARLPENISPALVEIRPEDEWGFAELWID